MNRLALFGMLLTAIGCNKPTPDPITHPCVVLAAKYGVAIDKGETNCTTNADCDCYQGGIGRKSGCGGVLNKESVAELGERGGGE